MGIMRDNLRQNPLPPVDEATITIDGQAITGAASYPATPAGTTGNYRAVDLGGVGTSPKPGIALNVVTTGLAGGTSLQARIFASDSPTSGFVQIAESEVVALANYAPFRVPVPACGYRYFQGQVVSLGTHTAGTATAWFA